MSSNRWINILGAVLVLLCTGSIYAFSVFSGPLALVRGWTPEQVALAFTISTAVCPIPMIIAGKIVGRGYARTAMLLGGASFGLAFLMMDWFSSLTALYLGYGVLGEGFEIFKGVELYSTPFLCVGPDSFRRS